MNSCVGTFRAAFPFLLLIPPLFSKVPDATSLEGRFHDTCLPPSSSVFGGGPWIFVSFASESVPPDRRPAGVVFLHGSLITPKSKVTLLIRLLESPERDFSFQLACFTFSQGTFPSLRAGVLDQGFYPRTVLLRPDRAQISFRKSCLAHPESGDFASKAPFLGDKSFNSFYQHLMSPPPFRSCRPVEQLFYRRPFLFFVEPVPHLPPSVDLL